MLGGIKSCANGILPVCTITSCHFERKNDIAGYFINGRFAKISQLRYWHTFYLEINNADYFLYLIEHQNTQWF
jgi:hypothetical protein